MRKLIAALCFLPMVAFATGDATMPLEHAHVDLKDKASLQRGAKYYMNYCAGCHSLKYVRYSTMAQDIGIINDQGEVYKDLVKDNLIFTDAKVTDYIKTAMSSEDAKQWFGMPPPDLSLIIRVRGADWVYTYLNSFYADPEKPLGTNNWLFPDVAMPNVLVNLQGVQLPVYKEKTQKINGEEKKIKIITHLTLIKDGTMSPAQFQSMVNDIVNYLAYVSQPKQLKSEYIGWWILGFLVIFAIVTYLLKREYWKDIKK